MPDASREAPLVAVVTPVYNGAPYLSQAMDAVQAQTYPNLVHIVLDNASTDATPEIVARYRQARVAVEVARNDHTLSLNQNWNAAVALVPAAAKYFRVLCADDLIEPEFVARTVDVAERYPSVAVVGCGLRHRSPEVVDMGWERDREIFPGQEAVRRFFLGTVIIIAHQTLFRRTVLDEHIPFFDEQLIANEDTDACLRLFQKGDWGFVHEVLGITRDHPGTHSRTVAQMKINQCEYLALLERHAEFGLGSSEGRRLTWKYRRHYLRQLLKWRAAGMRDVYDRHVKAIKGFSSVPFELQILDAVADWPLARVGLRPVWSGYPF